MKYSIIVGSIFWMAIVLGAILIDKGQNGTNIAMTQFWGAVLIFISGIAASYFMFSTPEDRKNRK